MTKSQQGIKEYTTSLNPDSEKGGSFFNPPFPCSLILCIVEMKNESSKLDRRKGKNH